jgi:L-2-hydroxycarboxylate dehydrogenase (NAD+)
MGSNVEPSRFEPSVLEAFTERAFRAVGVGTQDAQAVAGLMIRSDLGGSDTHGIFRLKMYIGGLKAGKIKAEPKISVERETANTAVVNGDSGLGHLTMSYASNLAIEKAKKHGMSWVGVNHGNHAGPGWLWAKMALEHDMIGMYSAVASVNHVPPWGGTELLLGTNPIAFAVPAAEEPAVVLDMATTVAAAGKVQVRAKTGEPMPEGWMIDKEGNPLTDASRHKEGYFLPIGGAKGYGLSLILALLAGTLNGASTGKNVPAYTKPSSEPVSTGQFISMISLSAFGDVGNFKDEVDRVVDELHSSPLMPGFDNIKVPGENSHAREQDRRANGIPLPGVLVDDLNGLASDLEIEGLS